MNNFFQQVNVVDQLRRWRFSRKDIQELLDLSGQLVADWRQLYAEHRCGGLDSARQDKMRRVADIADRRGCTVAFSMGCEVWVSVSKSGRRPWRTLRIAGDGEGRLSVF